jgi:hypothetical protein
MDKASTGYTFKGSDKNSLIVAFLQKESDLTKFP